MQRDDFRLGDPTSLDGGALDGGREVTAVHVCGRWPCPSTGGSPERVGQTAEVQPISDSVFVRDGASAHGIAGVSDNPYGHAAPETTMIYALLKLPNHAAATARSGREGRVPERFPSAIWLAETAGRDRESLVSY